MKIISISDTHGKHSQLTIPPCDILIHCGDFTNQGKKSEVEEFALWLDKQTQCDHIVISLGNHELYFEKELPDSRGWITDICPRAKVLIDEGCEIDGVKIWASPVTPAFYDWAWNRFDNEIGGESYIGNGNTKSYTSIKPHFDIIPNDTNILISHGPPYGILDQTTYANGDPKPDHLGSQMLMNRIKELKDLDLHFYGHIHSPGGNQHHENGVSFYNSAVCDEMYCVTNPITIVEYEKE